MLWSCYAGCLMVNVHMFDVYFSIHIQQTDLIHARVENRQLSRHWLLETVIVLGS